MPEGLPNKLAFTHEATGEMDELDVSTPDQIKAMYQYATTIEKDAKRLREALYPYGQWLVSQTDGKVYTFNDGATLTFVSGQKFKVPTKVVLQEIDPSQLTSVITISKTKLEAKLASMIKKGELDEGVAKRIQEAYVPNGANDHFTLRKAPKEK